MRSKHHAYVHGVFVSPSFIEILFLAPMISLSGGWVGSGAFVCVRLFLTNRPV